MTGLMGTYVNSLPNKTSSIIKSIEWRQKFLITRITHQRLMYSHLEYKISNIWFEILMFLQIVLWEIITRKTPYKNLKTPHAIMKYVAIEKKRPDLSLVPETTPKEVPFFNHKILFKNQIFQLIELMKQCWHHDHT